MRLQNDQLIFSPSDLTDYLACAAPYAARPAGCAGGPRRAATAQPASRPRQGEGRHERAYLAELIERGLTVVEISLGPGTDWENAAAATRDAIRRGVDVVYQAVFVDGVWRGVADFLERREDQFL